MRQRRCKNRKKKEEKEKEEITIVLFVQFFFFVCGEYFGLCIWGRARAFLFFYLLEYSSVSVTSLRMLALLNGSGESGVVDDAV